MTRSARPRSDSWQQQAAQTLLQLRQEHEKQSQRAARHLIRNVIDHETNHSDWVAPPPSFEQARKYFKVILQNRATQFRTAPTDEDGDGMQDDIKLDGCPCLGKRSVGDGHRFPIFATSVRNIYDTFDGGTEVYVA